jgi:hypothetical protein
MISACGAPLNGSKLVYLAGPITGTSYVECNDWRDYAASRFNCSSSSSFSSERYW